VLISQHRFVEAEQHLRELLQRSGQDAALLHNLGLTLYHQSRFREALDAFLRAQALGLSGQDTEARQLGYLTRTHHHLGDTAAALETARRWAAVGGDAAAGYLALVQMDHGDLAAAHQQASAVLARAASNVDAAIVEGMWSTENHDIVTATAHFDQVVRAEPDNARGWLGLALTHLYGGRNEAAIAALQKATALLPRHAGLLTTLGWARFIDRDLDLAERTFREAIALDRGFAEAHGGLALTLVYLKRYTEARRETRIAQRLNPVGFGAIYAHGALLAVAGRRALGEAEVAAALERPVMGDGRSLIQHLQPFLRRQLARRAAGGEPPPGP
jgi:tetratricopeptide (TPR) repeat protein